MELFSFPFFFSVYFCSIDDCVVRIVFDGYDQFSSALVYAVLESLYPYINAISNAGRTSSFFFSVCLAFRM